MQDRESSHPISRRAFLGLFFGGLGVAMSGAAYAGLASSIGQHNLEKQVNAKIKKPSHKDLTRSQAQVESFKEDVVPLVVSGRTSEVEQLAADRNLRESFNVIEQQARYEELYNSLSDDKVSKPARTGLIVMISGALSVASAIGLNNLLERKSKINSRHASPTVE